MKRSYLLVAVLSVVSVLLPLPAAAKGREPVKVVVQGPGLMEPLVIRGNMGGSPASRYWAVASVMFGSSLNPSVTSPPTRVDRGPRYRVAYVDPCCGYRVRQYLYPYAGGGPRTYTPAGQGKAMFQMNMNDYLGGGASLYGWHQVAPTLRAGRSFYGWHGIATTFLHLSLAPWSSGRRSQPGVGLNTATHAGAPAWAWITGALGFLVTLLGLASLARRNRSISRA